MIPLVTVDYPRTNILVANFHIDSACQLDNHIYILILSIAQYGSFLLLNMSDHQSSGEDSGMQGPDEMIPGSQGMDTQHMVDPSKPRFSGTVRPVSLDKGCH